jgi:hypothetical protein
MPDPVAHEEALESRVEAAPAVAVVVALQVILAAASRAEDWKTWHLPWWIWLLPAGPEIILLALLWLWVAEIGRRRRISIALTAFIGVANACLLFAVIASLVRGQESSGAQLLLKAMTVWATNVIAFGLWYWEFDRGGPVKRLTGAGGLPDFQFPQMENAQLARPGWQPHWIDYLYVSFTNSIAFSPTDAMPLTRWAKLLMLSESAISALTILLVAARAVNIFK